MEIFSTAFFLILFAEIADKSRVAGLLLVSNYRKPWPVFFGMTLAFALLTALAVFLGGYLPAFVPKHWLSLTVGGLFILFGLGALYFSEKAEDHTERWLGRLKAFGAFTASFIVIAVSEIADRTQVAAAAMTAQTASPWLVYVGAMSALVLLNFLTVWVGDWVARRISARAIHRISAILFIMIGFAVLFQAW